MGVVGGAAGAAGRVDGVGGVETMGSCQWLREGTRGNGRTMSDMEEDVWFTRSVLE